MKRIETLKAKTVLDINTVTAKPLATFNKAYFMNPLEVHEIIQKQDNIRCTDALLDWDWHHFTPKEKPPTDDQIIDACVIAKIFENGHTSAQLFKIADGSKLVVLISTNTENGIPTVHVGFKGNKTTYCKIVEQMSLSVEDRLVLILDET